MNAPASNHVHKISPHPSDAVEPIAVDAKTQEITDPDEIRDALAVLAKSGEPVSIYPVFGGSVVMARIWSVDPELPQFMIDLNEGGALLPGECICVTWLSSVKFQFRLGDARRQTVPCQPARISAEFPACCHLLNRRASPRLDTPLGMDFTASFVVGGKSYELPLFDFSRGGIGMRCAPHEATGLLVGRKLRHVELQLGPDSTIVCDLEIRLSRRFRSFLLGEQVQLGCRFMNLDQPMQEELHRVLKRMKGNYAS